MLREGMSKSNLNDAKARESDSKTRGNDVETAKVEQVQVNDENTRIIK